MWSANTVRLSNLPSPFVSSRRTMRWGFSSSCCLTAALEPEDSATYSLPSSSNDATIGRSMSGGAAASSIVKPGGTFGSGGADEAFSAALIKLEFAMAIIAKMEKKFRCAILQTPVKLRIDFPGVYMGGRESSAPQVCGLLVSRKGAKAQRSLNIHPIFAPLALCERFLIVV